ncbi:SRPBCC family protein [Modicisalibacter luteus]|uniref:SRPBCC family protein n=1 Tax=Modicisalibacter luteus TaxID=453962 RepID=UPI00362FE49D
MPQEARQQGHLHLPIPWLDVQERRQAAQGQERKDRRLSGRFQAGRLARSKAHRALRELSRLPVRQPERGCPALTEHLGETTKVIDNIVDQAPEGLEILRGTSSYTFSGNWKLGAENGADGYHVSTVHWNYSSTMDRRNYDAGGTKAVDANGWSKSMGVLLLRERPHDAVDAPAQSRGAPGLRPEGQSRGRVRRGACRFHRQPDAQSVFVSQRLPDGPVLHPDPRHSSDRRGQERGHHLLLRAQGGVRREPRAAYPPVRRLLQRQRHGHTG